MSFPVTKVDVSVAAQSVVAVRWAFRQNVATEVGVLVRFNGTITMTTRRPSSAVQARRTAPIQHRDVIRGSRMARPSTELTVKSGLYVIQDGTSAGTLKTSSDVFGYVS